MKQSQLIYFITEWTVKVDGEGKVDEAGARKVQRVQRIQKVVVSPFGAQRTHFALCELDL